MKVKLLNDGAYASLEHLDFPMVVDGVFDSDFEDGVSGVIVLRNQFGGLNNDTCRYKTKRYWFYNDHDIKEFEVIHE